MRLGLIFYIKFNFGWNSKCLSIYEAFLLTLIQEFQIALSLPKVLHAPFLPPSRSHIQALLAVHLLHAQMLLGILSLLQ